MEKRKMLIRQFYYLLNDLQIKEQKDNLLAGFGVESLNDLNEDQLKELNGGLLKEKAKQNKNEVPAEIRQLRSTVLSLLTDLGIYKDNNSWERVNSYLDQPQIAGQQLWEMNKSELNKLILKLRAIKVKRNKKVKEENHYARYN